MLTHRTNILFNEELWKRLSSLAKKSRTSVGELVRSAVKKQYIEEERMEQIKEAIEAINAFRKTHGKKLAEGEDSTMLLRKLRESRYGENYR